MVNVPIIGTVAAGKPRLAMEDVEDVFPLPQDFITGESFMLQVKGDSMIDDGIHEGDYVVVRRQQSADNGETVVAMVYDEASGGSEATVKRFFKERAAHPPPAGQQAHEADVLRRRADRRQGRRPRPAHGLGRDTDAAH